MNSSEKEVLEKLLNRVVPFAKQSLEKYGKLHPYGAALLPTGTISLIDTNQKEGKLALKFAELTKLKKKVRNGNYKATVRVVNSTVVDHHAKQRKSAIAAFLDTKYNSFVIYYPYIKTKNGVIRYSGEFATKNEGVIFD